MVKMVNFVVCNSLPQFLKRKEEASSVEVRGFRFAKLQICEKLLGKLGTGWGATLPLTTQVRLHSLTGGLQLILYQTGA